MKVSDRYLVSADTETGVSEPVSEMKLWYRCIPSYKGFIPWDCPANLCGDEDCGLWRVGFFLSPSNGLRKKLLF